MERRKTFPLVAIACGGTGGHLFPGLAIGEALLQRGCRVTLLISPKEVDQHAVGDVGGMEIATLPAVAFQSGSRIEFVKGFWKSWRAARKLFKAGRPDAVLAMGGFTSAPPVLAARRLGAKTFLHESNTIPGRANRWLARFVNQAFVGFPQATTRLRAREATVTGTPVRQRFRPGKAAFAKTHFGFDSARPVVLVTGGSQGATGVNELVLRALPSLTQRVPHWQWLHLTGPNDYTKVETGYASLGLKAVVKPFLAEMELALSAADAAVSRAGASSLAELAASGVPSVLIPYPAAADNHQYFNALAFAETEAACMLEQNRATPDQLSDLLTTLVEDAEKRAEMRAALDRWHAPRAAADIAELILKSVRNDVAVQTGLESGGAGRISPADKASDGTADRQRMAETTHA